MTQRLGRGIDLLFHDRGTRRGWVVSSTPRPKFTPGKDPVPIYRRLGGPQGWSGRAEILVPTGIRSRTVQPVVSHYADWATRLTTEVHIFGINVNINLKLTFIEPCIVIYFYSKTNEMHQFSNLFHFRITLYMFRTVLPSIIRSLRLYIQQQAFAKQILLLASKPNRYCWLLASKQYSSICLTNACCCM